MRGIVTWVLKKAGPPALELETVEAAEAFEKENRRTVGLDRRRDGFPL